MAEPLKNSYNQKFVSRLAEITTQYKPDFPKQAFIDSALDEQWPELELKDRMKKLARTLFEKLDLTYIEALSVLKPISAEFGGFEAMLFPEIVEQQGLNHWQESMDALSHFTCFSSSEFAVRPFIQQDPQRMMVAMLDWSKHSNEHIRRLASEGCRPRLPWAMALPEFKQDPQLILPILDQLKQDPSLYVRRSVANNINDISKDNPSIVKQLAQSWLGRNSQTNWIVKHGCRTLLKQGDPQVLSLFGYNPADHIRVTAFQSQQDNYRIGETLLLDIQIDAKQKLGQLRLEYLVHYVKANGKTQSKIFKLAEGSYSEKTKSFLKKHSLRQMSTRKHYPGEHRVELVVNGQAVQATSFLLHG